MGLKQRCISGLLRRRTRKFFETMPIDRFTLRIAHTVEEHEDAFRLLRMAYAMKGYVPVRGPAMRINPQHVLPESTVWVAYEGDQIVGTATVTADSAARLPLDKDYSAKLDALRATPGTRLVEFGALTITERCRGTGLNLLLAMAGTWFAHRILDATHLVCGVNPKVALYHQAIFGYESIGPVRGLHTNLQAPVQGMAVSLDTVQAQLERHFPTPMISGGLVHEHTFETLPQCIEAPPAQSLAELKRWKLPREDFQELFVKRSDRLASLDTSVLNHLNNCRSTGTVVGGRAELKLVVGADPAPTAPLPKVSVSSEG